MQSSTQFIVVVFAFLMLTLRAAFQGVTIEQDADDSDKANGTDDDSLGDKNQKGSAASTPRVMSRTDDDGFEMAYSAHASN